MEPKNVYFGNKMWVLFFVIVIMLVHKNNAQYVIDGNLYTCGGGCYSSCFILQRNPVNAYPCYLRCIGSCLSPASGSVQYYCQIGCSTELCLPLASDGGRLEGCLGNCGHACGA